MRAKREGPGVKGSYGGLTSQELGVAAGGMAYPAVSKAVVRMGQRLQGDRNLRALADKAETIMSYVQT